MEAIDRNNFIVPCDAAVDTDASLNLAEEQWLINVAPKEWGMIRGFGGIKKKLGRSGFLRVAHHIAGVNFVEAGVVPRGGCPSGTTLAFGLPGINQLSLDPTAMGRAPPSVIPKVIYRYDAPDAECGFSK